VWNKGQYNLEYDIAKVISLKGWTKVLQAPALSSHNRVTPDLNKYDFMITFLRLIYVEVKLFNEPRFRSVVVNIIINPYFVLTEPQVPTCLDLVPRFRSYDCKSFRLCHFHGFIIQLPIHTFFSVACKLISGNFWRRSFCFRESPSLTSRRALPPQVWC